MSDELRRSQADEPAEPPPPGTRLMAIVRWALIVVAALAAAWSFRSYAHVDGSTPHASASARGAIYRCPMHPEITSREPGECPICHMALVADEEAPHSDAPAASSTADGRAPAGAVPVTLSLDRLQAIGVRTGLAEARPSKRVIRASASVALPEQGVSEVHVRTSGFIEQIRVRETGVRVSAGEELFSLYSPEVFQAEAELLVSNGFGATATGQVEAARRKLELYGVPGRTIDAILATGKPVRSFPIVAPAAGFVTKKTAVLGAFVNPEATLYELVDLSRVYVVADLFQHDVAKVPVGTMGRFVSSEAGVAITAKVDLVYPQLDAQARTTRVRMQVANTKMALRPGEFGAVEFASAGGSVVVVPRDAVVDTGRVAYVFVDEGGGRLSPRTVTLGGSEDGMVEIASGIQSGDRIVTSATFLVDSESRLRGSLAGKGATP